jgi:hypothetical protein
MTRAAKALAEHVRAIDVRQEMDKEPVERREPWPGLLRDEPSAPAVVRLEDLAEQRRFYWRVDA